MFFLNKKNVDTIGAIRSRLSLGRVYTYGPGWHWKRVHFQKMSIEFSRSINPHMVIVGASGSGKSSLCKLIIKSIVRNNAHVAVLDPHNEYLGLGEQINASVYDASYNTINLFELDGMEEKEKASELTGLFRRAFRLGEVQSYTLYRCILYTYSVANSRGRVPSINDLLFTVKIFKKNSKGSESAVLEGLERRLSLIANSSTTRTTEMERVINGNSIFLLSRLHTNESQAIYMEGFLRKIYTRMLSLEKSGHARLYIIIDEAEKLGNNPILGRLAAEGRKYGIGIIAIAQRAKSIDSDIRNNASLFISFYQREPEELNYVSNFISGGNELGRFIEVKKAIRNLSRGNAVVLSHSNREPMVVSFDHLEVPSTNLEFSILDSSRNAILRGELLTKLQGKGISPEMADKKITEMISAKSVHSHILNSDSVYDGTWYLSMPRNSPEHDIRIGILSRHLTSMKISNKVYNNSYGPDLIAYLDGKKIAIEYETGTKSIEQTERMINLRKKTYSSIIIVTNDQVHSRYLGINNVLVIKFSEMLNSKSLPVISSNEL